jgi:hypothetical protein
VMLSAYPRIATFALSPLCRNRRLSITNGVGLATRLLDNADGALSRARFGCPPRLRLLAHFELLLDARVSRADEGSRTKAGARFRQRLTNRE